MVAVSSGDRLGWASPAIVASLAAVPCWGSASSSAEHRAGAPMLDLKLFHRPAFSAGRRRWAGVVPGDVRSAGRHPVLLGTGLGRGPGQAGLELTVMPLFLGLAALLAGRLSDRSGGRALTVTGMVVVTATLAVLAASKPGQATAPRRAGPGGHGPRLFTPPNNAAIMASAPETPVRRRRRRPQHGPGAEVPRSGSP